MILVDGNGTPLSLFTLAANHAEVDCIDGLIEGRLLQETPQRLLYDKAADADWLRRSLEYWKIELVCPHRRNRKKEPIQDGRKIRRYKRRYQVERTISWLFNYRRLVCRYEWCPELFEGFATLACLFTILKRF